MPQEYGHFYYREPFTIFPRKLRSGKVIFYYQFRKPDGTRSGARSLGTASRAEAMRRVSRLWYEGFFEGEVRTVYFKDFAQNFFAPNSDFLLWKEATGRTPAPSTLASYRQLLASHILPYFGPMRLSAITSTKVKEWVIEKRGEVSPKTNNNALSVLNIIFKAAVEKGLIKANPAEGLGYRKAERRQRELLTVDELRAIYQGDWRRESARRLFLTLAITGMRIGEAVGLLSDHVLEDRLNIEHSKSDKFGLGQTKTRTRRVVPIPARLNLKETCGAKWAFQDPKTGEPLLAVGIYKRFQKICKELGIDTKKRGLTVHTLRNFFISYMRSSPCGSAIDLKIKAVVGHTGATMTDWYTYWRAEDFAEIYALQEELLDKIAGKT